VRHQLRTDRNDAADWLARLSDEDGTDPETNGPKAEAKSPVKG
jgi:hypothetical protein